MAGWKSGMDLCHELVFLVDGLLINLFPVLGSVHTPCRPYFSGQIEIKRQYCTQFFLYIKKIAKDRMQSIAEEETFSII
jgi:hypothetical protein